MKVRTLETELWLPLGIEAVFDFFSDASNLDAITPPWLHFRIDTPRPLALHAGALIDYRLRLRWVPIRWRTAITLWEPPHRFVDEQLRGPYRRWVHRHEFEPRDGGTLIRDHVAYALPWLPLEGLVHRFLVGPDLRKIFRYRPRKIRELLAPHSGPVEDRVVMA